MDCTVRLSIDELDVIVDTLDDKLTDYDDLESSLISYIDMLQANNDDAKDEICDLLSLQHDISYLSSICDYLKTFQKYQFLRGIF